MNQVYSGTLSVEEVHRHYVEVIDLFNDEQFHEFKSCQPLVVQMSSINTATTAKEKVLRMKQSLKLVKTHMLNIIELPPDVLK